MTLNVDQDLLVLLYLTVLSFAFAGFVGYIAKVKGYPFLAWWMLGFLFWVLALVAVAIIPKKERAI